MLSSTFNFKGIPSSILVSCIMVIIISFVGLSILELTWRALGHTPTITDTEELWSLQREKLGQKGNQEIALLGGSRMQANVDPEVVEEFYPDFQVAQLAVNGTCANNTLYNLAQDETFQGLILLDLTDVCVLFGENFDLSQKFEVDFFKGSWTMNSRWNRKVANLLQNNLVLVDPYLNFAKIAGFFLLEGGLRPPRYWTVYESRFLAYHFQYLDTSKYNPGKLKRVENKYLGYSPHISPNKYFLQLEKISQSIAKIQERGGEVVIIRMPVSPAHHKLDEKYFPRSIYWKLLEGRVPALQIYSEEILTLSQFLFPDTSHLDASDAKTFTVELLKILIEKGFLPAEKNLTI